MITMDDVRSSCKLQMVESVLSMPKGRYFTVQDVQEYMRSHDFEERSDQDIRYFCLDWAERGMLRCADRNHFRRTGKVWGIDIHD